MRKSKSDNPRLNAILGLSAVFDESLADESDPLGVRFVLFDSLSRRDLNSLMLSWHGVIDVTVSYMGFRGCLAPSWGVVGIWSTVLASGDLSAISNTSFRDLEGVPG